MSACPPSQPCLQALRHHLRARHASPLANHPFASRRTAATFDPSRAAATRGGVAGTSKPPSHHDPSPLSSSSPSSSADPPLSTRLAAQLRSTAPSLTETYVAYGATELLVKECARVADYTIPSARPIPQTAAGEHLGAPALPGNWWYETLKLEPTFNSWAQVGMLHLWLLAARLRALGPTGASALWQQHLTDHFFYTAESKMEVLHGVDSRGLRQRYLKELFLQWRGVTAAYDEGVARDSDAVLAAAVWRNVCRGREDVDVRKLAQVVAYARSGLKVLGDMGDEVLAAADVVFGDPAGEEQAVWQRAKGMDEPFKQE